MPVLLAVGLSLSAGVFIQMLDASRRAELALAEQQAIQLRDTLRERIDSHILLLHALAGPFAGPGEISRDAFGAAAEPMLPLFPGLRAVAWARRVAPSDVPALEAEMRAAGSPGFTVRRMDGRLPPAEAGEDIFVNVLVEPAKSNAFASGIDITTLPGRKEVLKRSCSSEQILAAESIDSPGRETRRGLVLFRPVYRRTAAAGDLNDRCAALTGFVWASFDVDRLLDEAVSRVGPIHGSVYLLDHGAPEGRRVLAAREAGSGKPPLDERELSGASVIRQGADIGGRRWELVLTAPSASLLSGSLLRHADRSSWAVLIMGLMLTAGLAGYTRREARAKRLLQTEARARAAMARALRESEERFRLALRHSRVSVFSQDRSLRYIWMYNPQAPRPAEAFIGRTDAELYGAEDAALLDSVKRPVLESGLGVRREVRVTMAGQTLVFDLIVEPLRDDIGAIIGIICAAIDITEASQIREALAEAHMEAERANQAKSRFLAAASHDLRQPFQAMGLFHHILTARLTDPKQSEIAAKLGEALAAGNALLSTLLDTSALEAGNVKPRPADFAFQEVADRLATEIADQALGKGLRLRTVPTSAIVHSDPVLLERMVRNLLVNALRYTGQGRILLGCRRRRGFLRIEVWDTGPGIPPDQFERIFEDFYRCGTDRRDSEGGLGLGLSIVRRTAQILGHKVDVHSTPGRGTVFSISVPLIGDRRDIDLSPPRPAAAL